MTAIRRLTAAGSGGIALDDQHLETTVLDLDGFELDDALRLGVEDRGDGRGWNDGPVRPRQQLVGAPHEASEQRKGPAARASAVRRLGDVADPIPQEGKRRVAEIREEDVAELTRRSGAAVVPNDLHDHPLGRHVVPTAFGASVGDRPCLETAVALVDPATERHLDVAALPGLERLSTRPAGIGRDRAPESPQTECEGLKLRRGTSYERRWTPLQRAGEPLDDPPLADFAGDQRRRVSQSCVDGSGRRERTAQHEELTATVRHADPVVRPAVVGGVPGDHLP